MVEPGPFRTALHDKQVLAARAEAPGSPYAALMRAYRREAAKIRRGDPADVAEVIFRAATRARPRLRWQLGPTSLTGGDPAPFRPGSPVRGHHALGISLGRARPSCRSRFRAVY